MISIRIFLIVLGLFTLPIAWQVHAQDKLTEREKEIIQYDAKAFISEFELLLNTLASPELSRLEKDEIISNSYENTANQIFKDGEVIIENDINPENIDAEKVKDMAVERYLKDLDLFYSKSKKPTIDFFDSLASEVKVKEYIYLEVYFKSLFKGKHSVSTKPYKPTERVATIIANRQGNTWQMKIASVVFYDPEVHTFVREKQEEIVEVPTEKPLSNVVAEDTTSIPAKNKQLYKRFWEVGGFLGVASNTGLAPGLRIRYNILEKLGVQAGFHFFSKGEESFNTASSTQNAWELELNATYDLPITTIRAYVIAGLNLMNFEATATFEATSRSLSNTYLGVNIGLGASYPLNDKITPFLEAKYTVDNQLLAGLGLRYAIK